MITKEKVESMIEVAIRSSELLSNYAVHILCKTIFAKYKCSEDLNLEKFSFPHNEVINGEEVLVYHRTDLIFMITAFKQKYMNKHDSFDMLAYHGDILDILTMIQTLLYYEETMGIKKEIESV